MRLDPAGYPFIAGAAVPAAVLAAVGARRSAAVLGVGALYLTTFFRDPDRPVDRAPADPDVVLAPADGLVTVAGEPEPGVAPAGLWQQVSIFLSPLDVHVNRTPYGGVVQRTEHRPGRFLPAYSDRAAAANERTEIWLRDDAGREVVVRQIVGVLARRIVLRAAPGQRLRCGERIGLMKFGSRMDVFLPPDCTVEVERGTRVRGGDTVIGRW